jgi:hypothetical protein
LANRERTGDEGQKGTQRRCGRRREMDVIGIM